MKRSKVLKVTGILMIIGAALSILFGVIIGGVGALIAKFAGASTLGFAFYLGLATTLVGGIIQLIAGINGVKHCNKPENAKKCITWGIIVIALAVISNVLEVIGGGKFNVLSFVIGLIVPVLYIYGAFLMPERVICTIPQKAKSFFLQNYFDEIEIFSRTGIH